MARRRSGLPAAIRPELPVRANSGVGLDRDYPTRVGTHTIPAAQACRLNRPAPEMVRYTQTVMEHVQACGATHVRVLRTEPTAGTPGTLLLAWGSGPSAAAVAEKFKVSTSECGTPRIPAWLTLRVDTDFDLRWQPAI